jgi:hypothetical protein
LYENFYLLEYFFLCQLISFVTFANDCPRHTLIKISKKEKVCFDSLDISKFIDPTFNKSLKQLVNDNMHYSIAISTKDKCEGIGFSSLGYGHPTNWEAVNLRHKEAQIRCQQQNGCPCKVIFESGELIDEDLYVSLKPNVRSSAALKSIDKENRATINLPANIPNSAASKNSLIPIDLQISATEPGKSGALTINIHSNVSLTSLKINDEEQGGDTSGKYSIKKFAMIGKPTSFTILATDSNGQTESKTVTVTRKVVDSAPIFSKLNPSNVKENTKRDAVAIIIGIQDYKRLARAEYANTDAQAFYDYAVRALGIPPENIKLILDADADQVEIYKAFRNWLPASVTKGKTDVYVFYSGHGLPVEDGKSLYLFANGSDKDFLDKTAISQQEINLLLQAAQAKSVTLFYDSCYSGQSRTGETLLASARPIALKAQSNAFPPEFTVFTATAPEQMSWSSPDLKHGIFSFYLMKGMEGDADLNKDGMISIQEMQNYLFENVPRQAQRNGRTQTPQLQGDGMKLLVTK